MQRVGLLDVLSGRKTKRPLAMLNPGKWARCCVVLCSTAQCQNPAHVRYGGDNNTSSDSGERACPNKQYSQSRWGYVTPDPSRLKTFWVQPFILVELEIFIVAIKNLRSSPLQEGTVRGRCAMQDVPLYLHDAPEWGSGD